MAKQSTIHTLAHVLLTFFDSEGYDNVEIRRGEAGKLSVFFKDRMYHTKAKFTINFVIQDSPIILDFATDDPRLEGMFTEGYPGLRNTFMLGSMDETHTAEYWARRKKPKSASKRKSSRYKYQSKEERSKQVQAAKALLA